MAMECLLNKVVVLHYEVNFGIWVEKIQHTNARLVKKIMISMRNLYFKASKIVGCKMIRQFDLPFDFSLGSCNTFQVPDEKVLMCFSESSKNCHL